MRRFIVQVHDGTRTPGRYCVFAPGERAAERHAVRQHRRTTGRRVAMTNVVWSR